MNEPSPLSTPTGPSSTHPPSSAPLSLAEMAAQTRLPGRFIPIGLKLTVPVVALLLATSLLIADQLSTRARTSLIDGKRAAAEMLVDLFAASVAPAVDFEDEETLSEELKHLGASRDAVYAATWTTQGKEPLRQVGKPSSPLAKQRPDLERAQTVTGTDQIVLIRPIRNPAGKSIGAAVVEFTLDPENRAFAQTREKILIYALGLAIGIAAFVLAIVRLLVGAPLSRLARAIRRVQRGRSAQVEIRSHDEIGRLGEAFNVMANAIIDREQRLAAANQRVQELLDHMRQAIVVFGPGGGLQDVRSRQAEQVFDAAILHRATVDELLYPGRREHVEARAFREWLGVAFDVPAAEWQSVLELAPRSVTLNAGSDYELILALEFIPIRDGDQVSRVMLLATDETDKRHLERAVRDQELEHARQMSAMRRLMAGGGQLLVSILDGAHARLAACQQLLEKPQLGRAGVGALFRHIHTIKGEARSFDLVAVERQAATMEDRLSTLRIRLNDPEAFILEEEQLDLKARIDRLNDAVKSSVNMLVEASPIGPAILDQVTVRRPDLSRLVELVAERPDELGQVVRRLASRPFGESLLYLTDAIPGWAERAGKRVRLEILGRDVPIPPALARVLPGVLTHLARNAVAHGLEAPEERETGGKAPTGTLRIAAEEQKSGAQIVVEDDGRGLDTKTILDRAHALDLGGTAGPAELVFADGLSTSAEDADLAGRGVGLSAVREDLLAAGFDVTLMPAQPSGIRAVVSPNRSQTTPIQRRPS